jgi:DNA-binding beta-propeller fold protein YncE
MPGVKIGTFVGNALLGAILLMMGASCSNGSSSKPQASGGISTFAGNGTQGFNGDGKPLTESWLNLPMEMAVAPDGQIYVIDWNSFRIRRVKSDQTFETLIGTLTPGDWPCQDPDDPANCEVPLDGSMTGTDLNINHWIDLIFLPDDTGPTMYTITFAAWHNHKVTHYDPDLLTGNVSIITGNGKRGFDIKDPITELVITDGDTPQPARPALMDFPSSVAMDTAGNLFVSAERSNRVRRIAPDADRTVTTVVGSSEPATDPGYGGDDGPATQALLGISPATEAGGSDIPEPGGAIIMAADGTLYIADTYNNCIRKVVPGSDGIIGDGDPLEEIITRIAGICGEAEQGYSGDGGPALDARFYHPRDLDFGPVDGRLYVTDTDNSVVRAIDLTTGIIVTVAGNGTTGFSGDGGPATEAQLRNPYGSALDAEGNLYIVDTKNNRIRLVKN